MSRKTDPDKLSRMGRRRFLSTLGALGVSSTTLDFITPDALADTVGDLKEEIPYVAQLRHKNHDEVVNGEAPPEYEPQIKTMSRDKWIEMQAAHNAANNLHKRIRSIEDTGSISVAVTSRINGGVSERILKVKMSKRPSDVRENNQTTIQQEKLLGKLPSTMDGEVKIDGKIKSLESIPVKVETETPKKLSFFDHEYDPVPGGAMINPEPLDEGGGTICTPGYVKPPSDEKCSENPNFQYCIPEGTHLVTAAHVADTEAPVHQPGDAANREIGNMSYNWLNYLDGTFDAGTISLDSDTSALYDLANDSPDSYEGYTIYGYVTWDEIKSRAETGGSFEIRGINSGTTSSQVSATEVGDARAYLVEDELNPGDSGGPHYDVRYNQETGDQEVYIAGLTTELPSDQSGTRCTTMAEITEKLNVLI